MLLHNAAFNVHFQEGPMIHTGAIVASGIAQGLGLRTGIFKKYADSLRDDKNRREFVAAGGASGVASAFGTPLGTWHKHLHTFPAFFLTVHIIFL